ncbi:hypothetical protein [Actinocorallia populi]|uniref:hypothetical protein n=1 Tax=Actinocorallia populi TaxID=2079200 RepID=UPI0013002BBE|nr:hypothetical protein [Actinocorallia populi]
MVAEVAGWRVVLRTRDTGGDWFYGVAAASARAVWVVGESTGRDGRERPVTYHWDGGRWSVGELPVRPAMREHRGSENGTRLSASSDRNAWLLLPGAFRFESKDDPACGGTVQTAEKKGLSRVSRLLRWDGSGWRTALTVEDAVITSVVAAGEREAWAFGEDLQGQIVLRYDGTKWSRQASPLHVDDAKRDGAGAWAVGESVATGQPGVWYFGGARPRHIPFGGIHPESRRATKKRSGLRTLFSSLAVLGRGEVAVSGLVYVHRGCVIPEWALVREKPYQLRWNGGFWSRERGLEATQVFSQASDGQGGRYAIKLSYVGLPGSSKVMHRTASGRWRDQKFPGRHPLAVFLLPGTRTVYVVGADSEGGEGYRGVIARFTP